MAARGIRNNNCLNIRLSSEKWEGLSKTQNDKSFFQFVSPEWGIRAAYRILCTYNTKYHCKTLGQMISRWAPPNENDTLNYIRFVARFCGVQPEYEVNINNEDFMAKMIIGMCRMENGSCPYTEELVKKGIRLKNAKYVA